MSGIIIAANTIRRATVLCSVGDVNSSSLALIWVAGGELSLEGGGRGAVFSGVDNVISDVLFTPASAASCTVVFAMVHLSANVSVVTGALMVLVRNQVSGVFVVNTANTSQSQLSMDVRASGGCLLTVNASVSVGRAAGDVEGSELLIASNTVTNVNTSRSIVAFASDVSFARGAGMVIRGNTINYAPPTLETATGPWGAAARSLLCISGELSWASGWRGLRITENIITTAALSSSSPFPSPSRWVLFDNSEGSVRSSDALGGVAIVMCSNILFGTNQDRSVVSKAALVANPSPLVMPSVAPTYQCFTPSATPSLSVSATQSFSDTATLSFSFSSTLSFTKRTPSPPLLKTLTATGIVSSSKSYSSTANSSLSPPKAITSTFVMTKSRTLRIIIPIPFIPSPTLKQLTTAVGVSAFIGGLVSPTAGVTQGVSMTLMRMTQCGGGVLSEGSTLPAMIHPLQFGFGEGDAKYARGAIIGNFALIPLACVLLLSLVVPLFASVSRHGAEFRSKFASFGPRTGWPAKMIVPFSLLAEGSAMTSTALLFHNNATALDIFLGVIGVVGLLAVTMIWGLKLRFPFHRLRSEQTNDANLPAFPLIQ